ncbi:MAG: hypothetical protein O9972_13580 [Burkholderiales bacterium]|jgi:hypothetical protein|nr:hypothetical protein [Burkholderiales bacterium]
MIGKTMAEGPLRLRSALVAGVIASGTVMGCMLAALAVTVARWAFASQPLVTML